MRSAIFLNQNPKRPKAQTKITAEASCQKRGQARWCFCASATASATCASPPSSPWRRPSNLVKPSCAPVLRVCLNCETPTSFLLHLHLLLLPRPASPRTHFFLCPLQFPSPGRRPRGSGRWPQTSRRRRILQPPGAVPR